MVEAVAAAAVAATGTTHPPSSPATNGGYEKTWSSAFGTLRIPAAACMTNTPTLLSFVSVAESRNVDPVGPGSSFIVVACTCVGAHSPPGSGRLKWRALEKCAETWPSLDGVGSRLVAKWRGRGCDYGRRRVVATTARTGCEASVPSFAIDGAGSDRLRKAVYLVHFRLRLGCLANHPGDIGCCIRSLKPSGDWLACMASGCGGLRSHQNHLSSERVHRWGVQHGPFKTRASRGESPSIPDCLAN